MNKFKAFFMTFLVFCTLSVFVKLIAHNIVKIYPDKDAIATEREILLGVLIGINSAMLFGIFEGASNKKRWKQKRKELGWPGDWEEAMLWLEQGRKIEKRTPNE